MASMRMQQTPTTHFSLVFTPKTSLATWIVSFVLLGLLAGCGGGPETFRDSETPTRIQDVSLDAEEGGVATLRLNGDRPFHNEVTANALQDAPGVELQVPFAIATREFRASISDLKLPRNGIRAISVENLASKFGGVRIIVQTQAPVSPRWERAGQHLILSLKTKPAEAKEIHKDENKEKKKKPHFIVPEVTGGSDKDYIIGGRDVLKIVVFEEPDLSKGDLRVSNEGFITFPLIGRVRAAGLTPNELEKEITRRLAKDYLVNPQVSVQVTEFASKVVNVLGAVKNPGAIPLNGPTTLLETLARAGGVNVDEAGRNIIVLRPSPGKEKGVKHMTLNLNLLLKGGDLSQNIMLEDKDTVFIPQADQIFVFGEVKNPGPYKLKERTVSVVEAITMAGGPTRLAAPNRTRIVRVEDGKEKVIHVNVEDITKGDKSQDLPLQAGDIVVVPEAYF